MEARWASSERGPQRLRYIAELDRLAICERTHGLPGCRRSPWLDSVQITDQVAQELARLRGQQGGSLILEHDRPVGDDEACAIDQLQQGLGSLLQSVHGLEQLSAHFRRQLGGKIAPAGNVRKHVLDFGKEIGIGGLANVVAVEAFKLCEVETRRRASDLRQVEGGDHLRRGEDFLVAMTSTEPYQIIAHCRGQVAQRTISVYAERAVPLGKLEPSGPWISGICAITGTFHPSAL